VSFARYLGKTFWPVNLATPYPHPGHWELVLVICSVALIAGLSAIAVLLARKFPFAFTGWFWFVGTLVPVIGLVQVGGQSMADRYMYLPLIGLFIVLAWGIGEVCLRWRVPRTWAVFLAAIVLVPAALRSRDQLGYWQNDGTLFRHALVATKNNYVASINLGTWLSKQGQVMEAMGCFNEALRMHPSDPSALYDLGNAFSKLGNWDDAIASYRRALQITPDQADILNNLGFALAAKKQFTAAVTNFEAALTLKPDSASAHNNLASVLFAEQKFDEAAGHYREALRLTPDNPQIYANLGDTLLRMNQPAEAAKCYLQALQLNPDDAKSRAKLRALGAPVSN
jgi:Flp pilus assembly protein TadD